LETFDPRLRESSERDPLLLAPRLGRLGHQEERRKLDEPLEDRRGPGRQKKVPQCHAQPTEEEEGGHRGKGWEERLDERGGNPYTRKVDIKTKRFVYHIAPDCRMRHVHRRLQRKVVSFAVQLEVRHPTHRTWMPVVRYDTVHGFAHRDQLHPDGTSEKIPLPIEDDNQALTYAETDLKDHWQVYRSRFLEELKHEERQ
jgi:hypothetical protein